MIRSGIPKRSDWDALSEEDRAEKIAYWRTRDNMAAWEQWNQERRGGGGRKPDDEFD